MCELTSPLSHYVARITALRLQITVMRILKIFAKNSSSPDAKGRFTTDSLSWDLAPAVAVEARSLSHTEKSRRCLLSLFLYFNMHCTVSIIPSEKNVHKVLTLVKHLVIATEHL